MHGQELSDNEIYLLIKYIKSVLWRVAKRLSYEYIVEARCLNVKHRSFAVWKRNFIPIGNIETLACTGTQAGLVDS